MLTRRTLLGAPLSLALTISDAIKGRPWALEKSPMRIYYSDDGSDLYTNASPYHRRSDPVTADEIHACVDEALNAGADVFVSQPGTGWIPWWKSQVYPADEHYRWFSQTFGMNLAGVEKFMADGGDLVATILQRCRERQRPMLVSIRLNDIHSIVFSGQTPDYIKAHLNDPAIPAWMRAYPYAMSRLHMDHPEWRIDPRSHKSEDMIWDYAVPEAFEHKLALCSEVVTQYDVDGIELDFMRYPRFFKDSEPIPNRIRIMSAFISKMRAALDSKRKGRELALRAPPQAAAYAALGLDLGALHGLGVTRINVSSNMFDNQDVDFDGIRALAQNLDLTLELGQTKHFLQYLPPRQPGDDFLVLASVEDDLCTAALAQDAGFGSLSLFNFSYYRRPINTTPDYDTTHEPPFAVIDDLKRPRDAKLRYQSWFLGTIFWPGQLPAKISPQEPALLHMRTTTLPGRWAETGSLRFVVKQDRSHDSTGSFDVRVNGHSLARSLATPVDDAQEDPGLPFHAWSLPRTALRSGRNDVEIHMTQGAPAEIALLEIMIPAA